MRHSADPRARQLPEEIKGLSPLNYSAGVVIDGVCILLKKRGATTAELETCGDAVYLQY